jgi:hypothetical protein
MTQQIDLFPRRQFAMFPVAISAAVIGQHRRRM